MKLIVGHKNERTTKPYRFNYAWHALNFDIAIAIAIDIDIAETVAIAIAINKYTRKKKP